MSTTDPYEVATRIIKDAGGELVGRTRLQKVTFLAQLAGFDHGFEFEYRHYGPFSEDLARSIDIATLLGDVEEEERRADWGGRYSIYKVKKPGKPSDPRRAEFIQAAKAVDANELELAATAAYIYAVEGIGRGKDVNPWEETRRRKPEKATPDRLDRAKRAYDALRQIKTPETLPELPNI